MFQRSPLKRLFISIFLLGYFFAIGNVSATSTPPTTTIKKVIIDSNGNRSTPAAIEIDLSNPSDTVEAAITSGNALLVADSEHLLDATLAAIAENKTLLSTAKAQLFNLNADGSTKADGSSLTAISWNPTHDAATLVSTYGINTPVLQTNNVFVEGKTIYNKEIGIIGEQAGNTPSRYMVLGSNPMRNYHRNAASINDQMHRFLENSLAWLTHRDDLATTPFNVVIAHMDDSYYFPDDTATRNWLDEHFAGQVNYNTENSCEDDSLAGCLSTSTDLLIISQKLNTDSNATSIASTVKSAMDQGIPVLYMHWDGCYTDLGKALFPLFNISYEWDNYWKKLGIKDFDGSQTLNSLPANIASIETMLKHFKAKDYAFDWSACDNENCSAVTGLESEFLQGATNIKTLVDNLDTSKINLFDHAGFRLQKLLILLADHYRQDVRFPMDKVTTDDTVFMKAYFTDHAIYNHREVNAVQTDMGNFSRSDFSHITPTNKTINMTSKKYFRSAGVYALPGQTFSITRNDTSDLSVKVFINTQRSGSTHQWASNGYKRPKYLQTPHIEIASGETLNLTSPYGGTVQLEFSDNDLPVEFEFNHIGLHPYWKNSMDDDDFTAQLAANEYDWAELVTSGFEVHSSTEKMQASLADSKWGSATALAAATTHYTSNYPHVLAGFKGPGIDVVPELHDFAAAKGWTIDNIDLTKHMNADQATCGYGCSGNPYDAYWSFDPIGHGDIHELGHSLQGSKRFIGWENHSMTNHYSYYTKSKYNEETGGDPDCQSLPFKDQFTTLQASINQADPASYMQTHWWDTAGWSQQASMFIQLMMSAQAEGALENGWHLRARLHILEREYNRAKRDETTWLQKRDSLGFSQYSLDDVNSINNNDWLLIAISYSTERDYRDYLSMWGLPYSAKADAQVASYGYAVIPKQYHISSPDGYCKSQQNGDFLAKKTLPVDGQQSWPEEIDTDEDGVWDSLDNCPTTSNADQTDDNNNGIGNACEVSIESPTLQSAALHNVIRQALNNQTTLSGLGVYLDQSYDFSQEPKPSPALPDLQDDAALEAQTEQFTSQCIYKHPVDGNGSNLFAGTGSSWTLQHAISAWAYEVGDFDYTSNECAAGKKCKHYTQMVWENSGKVACAVQSCPSISDSHGNAIFDGKAGTLIICEYAAAGNIIGNKPYRTEIDTPSVDTSLKLTIKTLLQGAYNSSTGNMGDDLRQNNRIPATEPYTQLGHTALGNKQLNSNLLEVEGNNSIIDWILFELRDKTNPSTVITSVTALLQQDGYLIDPLTGSSHIQIAGLAADDYYIAIRHRNHLGIMTAQPVSLSSTVTNIDFTNINTQTWGDNARLESGTTAMMWAGDANHDGKLIATGPNNDVNSLFSDILLAPANTDFNANYVLLTYGAPDVNLDGKVIFSGDANDENIIRGNILLNPSNASFSSNYIVEEQLPK